MAGCRNAGDRRAGADRTAREPWSCRRRRPGDRARVRVLAFDTATALTAVALRDFDDAANVCLRTVADLTAVDAPPAGGRPGHAQRLLALIQELFEQAGAGWEEVDR